MTPAASEPERHSHVQLALFLIDVAWTSALAVGVVAIVWPGVTVFALVVIFAIAAFSSAFLEFEQAWSSDGAGAVIGSILLGIIDVAAGIVALAWPGITAFVLTVFIGIWAVVAGVGEVALAFGSGESGENVPCSPWVDWCPSPWRGPVRTTKHRSGLLGGGLRALQPGVRHHQPRPVRDARDTGDVLSHTIA